MAFSGISAQQELNQRKILEDIQLKKQQMLQGAVSTGSSAGISPYMQLSDTVNPVLSVPVGNNGYFISQDSAFGNTILPVLPRYDNAK